MSRLLPRLRRSAIRGALQPIVIAVWTASSVSAVSLASLLPESVPRFLADAARTSVGDFAFGLAAARIPAGFIAFDSDSVEVAGAVWRSESVDKADHVPSEIVISTFRTKYPGHYLEDRDGVLLIRARKLEVAGALAGKIAHFQVDGVPLSTAFNEAMRIVNPAVPARSGIIGSMISTPGNSPDASAFSTVTVDLTNASFLDVLNEIVKRVPGTVWMLSRHGTAQSGAGYYTLAFRSPEGTITRFDDHLD